MKWTSHPAFLGATSITSRVSEIDDAVAAAGPRANAFIPAEFERRLTQIFGGVPVRWPAWDGTGSFFKTLALTISNIVQSQMSVEQYALAEIRTLRWVTNHGRTVCEKCRAADGATVRIGEMFPFVGVSASPAHPGCCCAVVPGDEEFQMTADDLAASASPNLLSPNLSLALSGPGEGGSPSKTAARWDPTPSA